MQPDRFIESILSNGCGLRVAFRWQRDRYAHEVQCLVDGTVVPLLTSVEGTAEDRWPPSPPFQQLSIEDREDGTQVALLVGMAGKSHWSSAIRFAQAPRVTFDLACLARHPPERIGSAYRAQLAAGSRDGSWASFSLSERMAARLSVEGIDGAPPARLLGSGSDLIIAGNCELALPTTVRWKYAVELTFPGEQPG